MRQLGYNTETLAEKIYSHSLKVFIDYAKDSASNDFAPLGLFLAPKELMRIWKNNYRFGTEEKDTFAANELLSKIPNSFTDDQKLQTLETLEGAIKDHYSMHHSGLYCENWEKTDLGKNLIHAKSALSHRHSADLSENKLSPAIMKVFLKQILRQSKPTSELGD